MGGFSIKALQWHSVVGAVVVEFVDIQFRHRITSFNVDFQENAIFFALSIGCGILGHF